MDFFCVLLYTLITDTCQDRSSSPPPPLPERTPESFFLADEDYMQVPAIDAYPTSYPNTMENSTSSKQTLKTPGKSFTRSKVKKMGVYGNISEAFYY